MSQEITPQKTPEFNTEITERLLNQEVTFGKYAGFKLRDIPQDYIVWYTENFSDNGYNNDLRRLGHKIKDQWAKNRSNATKILIDFNDSRYEHGSQQAAFFMSEELMERALNGLHQLQSIGAYSVSFQVPNHMILIGGLMPAFKYDLLIQMSKSGYTVLLANHAKKEVYMSKIQKFEP